jgi:hypothetical protein
VKSCAWKDCGVNDLEEQILTVGIVALFVTVGIVVVMLFMKKAIKELAPDEDESEQSYE